MKAVTQRSQDDRPMGLDNGVSSLAQTTACLDGHVEIRRCTRADLELLCTRWPVPGEVHEHHFADQEAGRATYLVAWRGDEPLGSGLLQWEGCVGGNARAAYPEAVEFTHVQVRDGHRSQGVGSGLIESAEEEATAAGRACVAVGVGDDNPGAERLYVRLGYRATGVFDVCEYDWADGDGAVHHEIERNQLLVRRLRTR